MEKSTSLFLARVQSRALAAASRQAKASARKPGKHLADRQRNAGFVRETARSMHLAHVFLRGVPYRAAELTADSVPDVNAVFAALVTLTTGYIGGCYAHIGPRGNERYTNITLETVKAWTKVPATAEQLAHLAQTLEKNRAARAVSQARSEAARAAVMGGSIQQHAAA